MLAVCLHRSSINHHHKVLSPVFLHAQILSKISCQMHECLDKNSGSKFLTCMTLEKMVHYPATSHPYSSRQRKYIPFVRDIPLRPRHYRPEPNVH